MPRRTWVISTLLAFVIPAGCKFRSPVEPQAIPGAVELPPGMSVYNLQLKLVASSKSFRSGAPIKLTALPTNLGRRRLKFHHSRLKWYLVWRDEASGAVFETRTEVSQGGVDVLIAPGKQSRLGLSLDNDEIFWCKFIKVEDKGRRSPARRALPPGKYTVTATYTNPQAGEKGYWSGMITSSRVKVEIRPAASVAWGETVKGLQAGLSLDQSVMRQGDPVKVALHFRNVSDKSLTVWGGYRLDFQWRIVFTSEQEGVAWRALAPGERSHWMPGPRFRLSSGQKVTVRFPEGYDRFMFYAPPKAGERGSWQKALPAGKYVLRATTRRWKREGLWSEEASTGEVKVEVKPKD